MNFVAESAVFDVMYLRCHLTVWPPNPAADRYGFSGLLNIVVRTDY